MITIKNIKDLEQWYITPYVYLSSIYEGVSDKFPMYQLIFKDERDSSIQYNIYFYRKLGKGGDKTKYLLGCPEANLGEYLSYDELKDKYRVCDVINKLIKSAIKC